jgi:hypothetical protein
VSADKPVAVAQGKEAKDERLVVFANARRQASGRAETTDASHRGVQAAPISAQRVLRLEQEPQHAKAQKNRPRKGAWGWGLVEPQQAKGWGLGGCWQALGRDALPCLPALAPFPFPVHS